MTDPADATIVMLDQLARVVTQTAIVTAVQCVVVGLFVAVGYRLWKR